MCVHFVLLFFVFNFFWFFFHNLYTGFLFVFYVLYSDNLLFLVLFFCCLSCSWGIPSVPHHNIIIIIILHCVSFEVYRVVCSVNCRCRFHCWEWNCVWPHEVNMQRMCTCLFMSKWTSGKLYWLGGSEGCWFMLIFFHLISDKWETPPQGGINEVTWPEVGKEGWC